MAAGCIVSFPCAHSRHATLLHTRTHTHTGVHMHMHTHTHTPDHPSNIHTNLKRPSASVSSDSPFLKLCQYKTSPVTQDFRKDDREPFRITQTPKQVKLYLMERSFRAVLDNTTQLPPEIMCCRKRGCVRMLTKPRQLLSFTIGAPQPTVQLHHLHIVLCYFLFTICGLLNI